MSQLTKLMKKRSRNRRRKTAPARDFRTRQIRFETLEDRWLLAVNFTNVANALDGQLTTMQTRITSALNNYATGAHSTIPVVGDELGNTAQIVSRSDFAVQLKTKLTALGVLSNPSDAAIQNALSTVPLLADRGSNGVGAEDVLITRPGNLGSEGFAVQMRLYASQMVSSTTVSFDTGLPALPFSVSSGGSVDVSVGFVFEFAFTYNSNNGQVAIDSTKTLTGVSGPDGNHPIADAANPLAIFVTATPSANFTATATLGFISGTTTPLAGQPNALYVTALVNNLTSSTPTVKLDGGVNLNLLHTGGLAAGNDDFPGVEAEIHLSWTFNSSNPTANAPNVAINNVYIELGELLSTVAGPVIDVIQTTTEPLNPVIELLNTRLPGLSDLNQLIRGEDITLLDLAGTVAPYTGFGPLYKLVKGLIPLIDRINQIQTEPTVRIPLGGFDLSGYDLRTISPAGNINNLNLPNLTNFQPQNLQIPDFDGVINDIGDQGLKDLVSDLTADDDNGYKVSFPILDRPQDAAFNLLLGRDTDLFAFEANAHVNASAEFMPSLSVFGMGLTFGGEVDLDTKFRFAYDTYGLRRLISLPAQGDITDGFYVDATSHFDLSGQIHAGVGVSAAVFSAKVGGFVSTDDGGEEPVKITIDDPNHDGKLRFAEFETNPFHTSGKFSAALGIEVRVGVEILGEFVGWKDRFDIATVVLVDLNEPGPNPLPEPGSTILASQPDASGTIDLYIGDLAGHRGGVGVSDDDGDEKIIIRPIQTTGDSQTIEIALEQEVPILGTKFWATQTIAGVKRINGTDNVGNLNVLVLPGVNVDVDLRGGQGRTDIWYNGTGSAFLQAGQGDSYLDGGNGPNTLLGGPGNDTLILGPSGNFVAGGAGNNMVVISTPYTDAGLILGGSDPNAENTVVVVSGADTAAISALPGSPGSIALTYQLAGSPPPSTSLTLRDFSKFVVSSQDRATNITVGDLSPAGVDRVVINIPALGDGGRHVTLDTKADGAASQISVDPFVHTYYDVQDPPQLVTKNEIQVTNATTGVTAYLLGMRPADVTTIRQHGGSAQIGQLSHGDGTLMFDVVTRQTGVTQSVSMTTPTLDLGNQISSYGGAAGEFIIEAGNFPKLIFQGLQAIDSVTVNVAAPGQTSGTNVVDLDASAMHGALTVNALGAASAKNDITLSHAALDAAVAIHGGSTTATLLLGTGQLANIRHDVTATNVELTVDDSAAATASLLTLTASTLGNWLIPGQSVTPRLNFSGLRGAMEVFAGAGDRFQLDVTPADVTSLTMHNDTATLDRVYTANWAVPLILLGNFAFYAGQRLRSDGVVERVKRLAQVGVPVTLDFFGVAPTEVILDGDLDPAGAQYTIDGKNKLHARNQTVGLDVTITGFRDADRLYVFMPGASATVDLHYTSPGTIYFDGSARLAGTNPTAANQISVEGRYGQTEMVPLDQYNSRLDMFNDLYVLGSMPQDDLTVNVPTNVKISMAAPSTFDIVPLAPNGSDFTITPARTDAVIAWKDGVRPATLSWNFIFVNPSASEWDHTWYEINNYDPPRFPNPLGDLPYEISGYVDGPIGVVKHQSVWNGQFYVVQDTSYSGTARYFLVDPNPVATNNNVRLNASQLRGAFHFNVAGPNYDYISYLLNDSLYSLPRTNFYNNGYQHGTGAVGYDTLIAFGQSDIVLSGAHPESSVQITSQNRPFAYTAQFPDYFNPARLKGKYPGTTVHVGDGSLANVQGQVSVDKVWLKDVDNRQGSQPNIVALMPTALTWTGASGAQATLSIGRLYGELIVTGSPYDRFAVEGTPNTAWKTTIQNFATTQPPVGVYVMAKTVMPLDVTGNFDLYVGQRLNADGTVTAVGQVRNVYNSQDKYRASGDAKYSVQGLNFDRLFHNLELVDRSFEFLPSTHINYSNGGYNDLYYNTPHRPLPVFYNYTGAGQGKFVFDAHNEPITGTSSDFFSRSGIYMHGISTNYLYPGQAQLQFYTTGNVVYGPNAEVFVYGPNITLGTSYRNPAPAWLIDNPFASAVHYIANPNNTAANLVEEVLIGNVRGPVYVEGNGRATRVEINPLFSLPIGWNNNGLFETQSWLFPGWGRGHTGGYSLVDTISAAVTVNNAALRVIADIPLPTGSPPVATRPNVTLSGSELTGIAGSPIRFSNLVDSISTVFGSGQLDLTYANYLPGLSIQLPAHAPVSTNILNTPAGATTVVSTLLSASDAAMTDGPITVRGTAGPLVLGHLFGPIGGGTSGVDFRLYPSYQNVVQAVGNLAWADGLSVPQITIGNNGSLQNILGAILISGDSHNNAPLVTIIDGRNDPSRSNVSFSQPTYTQRPNSIVSWAYDAGLSRFYQQVDGFAPAPIYFGDFYKRPHNLQLYGSAGSTYNIAHTGFNGYPSAVPPTMKLYTGASGQVVYNAYYAGPMSIIGATSVQMTLGSGANGSIPGYVGVPEIFVEQDSSHPQPIDLQINRRADYPNTPNAYMASRGNGLMAVSLDAFFWRVIYPSATAHMTYNFGFSPLVISDTGTAGTVVAAGNWNVDVYGTTGPLVINASGTTSSRAVRLGPTGDMRPILGEVEVRSNAAPLGVTTLALNNSVDTLRRDIHLANDVDGNTRVTGMAPGLIKLVGERFTPTFTGGAGGSTWYVDTPLFPATSGQITIGGGATSDLLVGPNLANTWLLDGTNSVRLGANVRANNMRSLRGGSNTDLFRSMNSSGTIAGNLDGGVGFNTLEYVSVPSPFVTDLVAGIAPRIGGSVQNIQAVIPEQLTFTSPASLSHKTGDVVSVQLSASSTVGGTLVYGASGLPSGLSINPATGLISGTISSNADLFGPYRTGVTVSNGTNSRLRYIDWSVTRLLAGDYNDNTVVDTADYTVWQDRGGSAGAYDIWRANFGRTTSTPGGGSVAPQELVAEAVESGPQPLSASSSWNAMPQLDRAKAISFAQLDSAHPRSRRMAAATQPSFGAYTRQSADDDLLLIANARYRPANRLDADARCHVPQADIDSETQVADTRWEKNLQTAFAEL